MLDGPTQCSEPYLLLLQQSQASADVLTGIAILTGLELGGDKGIVLGGEGDGFAVLHASIQIDARCRATGVIRV